MHSVFAAISVAFVLLMSAPAYADKTNFSHTTIGISAGTGTYKTPICGLGYCMRTVGVGSLGGSIQFANDSLIGSMSSTAVTHSNPSWTYQESDFTLGLDYVKAIGDRIDVALGVRSLSATSDTCVGLICAKYNDSGFAFGGTLYSAVNDAKTLVAGVSLSSSKYTKSTKSTETIGLGAGYYFTQNHAARVDFGTNDGATSSSIGYFYSF